MTLSLGKLKRMLNSQRLIPKRFFVIGGLCVYVQALSLFSGDTFLIYIPSKYEITIEKCANVHALNYIEVDESGTIPGDYAGEPDNLDLEKTYEEVDLELDTKAMQGKEDLENRLEENYKHPLSLKDLSREDMTQLREIFRQLRRLRFCVQNLRYKVCIMFMNFLCCVRRDDTFEGFIVKGHTVGSSRQLYVSVDLETLYAKLASVPLDIKTVRQGIHRVLDKNQLKHAKNLHTMLEHRAAFSISSEEILKRKANYALHLQQLEELLSQLAKAERVAGEKIALIEKRYETSASLKGLHTDIEKTHLLAKHETELSEMEVVRSEIVQNIDETNSKLEDLSLRVDKICFDNTVMLDAIIKNFAAMKDF